MHQTLTKKQQTHHRMLDAASRSFKTHGFAGVGVDGIAKAAGVTSGAFYAHLGSKNAAFEAILIMGLDEVIDAIPQFQRDHGANWIKAFTDYYLDPPHRDDLSCSCAMAALTPEVIRADNNVKSIYQEKMTKITSLIAAGLDDGSLANRKARAWVFLSTLIGGLNIIRAMADKTIAGNIAKTFKLAAISAAGKVK